MFGSDHITFSRLVALASRFRAEATVLNTPTRKRVGIGHIPPEILGEIFIHCLPIDSASHTSQNAILSSVCRHWHALALTIPALWASLDITCTTHILRPPLPAIRTHLQRSGTHPLSITLYVADGSDYNLHFPAILMALAATRQRWHSVKIGMAGPGTATQAILDLIRLDHAPLLQSVQWDVSSSPLNPIPLHMLHHCPRLESFHWHSLPSSLLLPRGNTRLTSLSLQAIFSVSECVTLLRLSPCLSSVEFYTSRLSDSSTIPHLTHPTLRTLAAKGMHFTGLLDALTLPALLNLDLAIQHTGCIALSAFLARSKPTLRQLSLSVNRLQSPEPELLRILILTPHLHRLKLFTFNIDPSPITGVLIRALHPSPPPGAPLCPHLQILVLSGVSDCPDGLCSAMLLARWGVDAYVNGVVPLESAHIRFTGGMHDLDQADIQELRTEGMEVMIGVKNWPNGYQGVSGV